MGEWINADGLRVLLGTTEAEVSAVGEYGAADPGSTHLVQLDLNPEVLDAVGKKVHWAVRLPGANGQTMYIKKAEIHVEEAFAGATFTLDIGLDEEDGTVIDADGIDAGVATADLTAGAVVECDGALVNTRVAAATTATLLTTTVAGEVPTAGKAWLKVWYYTVNE